MECNKDAARERWWDAANHQWWDAVNHQWWVVASHQWWADAANPQWWSVVNHQWWNAADPQWWVWWDAASHLWWSAADLQWWEWWDVANPQWWDAVNNSERNHAWNNSKRNAVDHHSGCSHKCITWKHLNAQKDHSKWNTTTIKIIQWRCTIQCHANQSILDNSHQCLECIHSWNNIAAEDSEEDEDKHWKNIFWF